MLRTVSLKLAEKLRDAGFPQNTCYFSWGYSRNGVSKYPTRGTPWGDGMGRIADAPTAEEILDLLTGMGTRLHICHEDGMWIVTRLDEYLHEHDGYFVEQFVDAAAKAWLLGKKVELI